VIGKDRWIDDELLNRAVMLDCARQVADAFYQVIAASRTSAVSFEIQESEKARIARIGN
jgi:hypothetical protein